MSEAPFVTARILKGTCMCGAAEYTVEDRFEYAMNCHCSNCRRTTGSAFKPFAGIVQERLRLVCSPDAIIVHGDASGRDIHCAICGSLLYSVVRDNAYVHVTMGTLVDDPSIRPSMHIFVGSKASWYDILDDLPQYDAFPPD